jgi:hypothetical protein
MSPCCQDFFAKSGWHCQPLKSNSATSTVLYVSTPFLLINRKPLDFYVQESNGLVSVYDDGVTLFSLSGNGFDLSERRNWKGLRQLADGFGFKLDDSGEFKGARPVSEFMGLCADAIALFAAIRTWEKERSGEGDANFSLTRQVEEILSRNSPERKIISSPKVSVGNTEVVFDFQWGEIFVDALAPVANAVNSRLRKGLLMQRIDSVNNILFVIDDSFVPLKADTEMAVLGGVAPSVKLSTLRNMSERYLAPF